MHQDAKSHSTNPLAIKLFTLDTLVKLKIEDTID
jgi:hypothetical protein